MKWLLCSLLLSALTLSACGGGASSPSPSPSPSPSVECSGALPDENISFRGRVVSLQAPTPTAPNTIHGVLVELQASDIAAGVEAFNPRWFEPNAQLWVSLRGDDWPEFRVGECVVGTGRIQGFSCSDGSNGECDAVRFEADTLVESNGSQS
jgi:hypothetical protein